MGLFTRGSFTSVGQTTSYLDGGPRNGPLLIFVHGWPDIAHSWKHQLVACSALGFRVVAPDMRGYGESTAPRDSNAYALEHIVQDMVALITHLQRPEAVWIGHDWGVPVISALAAHYPQLCTGIALLAVPYRTFELGWDLVEPMINRELYPKSEYPYGQFEYQQVYERDAAAANKALDTQPEKFLKLLYTKSDPSDYLKPAKTAHALRDGLFGSPDRPDIADLPLSELIIDESLYDGLVATAKKNGFFPATSYYLNHVANAEYAKSEKNRGVLEFPVLFLDARFDAFCSPQPNPGMAVGMRKMCKYLTECSIEAGHWLHLEKPAEVNAALLRWLATVLPKYWPYYWRYPFVQ